jgi:MoxR-like ATPase
MVLATQNPVEQEGTYPLPEAQMDRFLMHVMIDYPDDESELEIMRLNREEQKEKKKESTKLSPFLGTWITKAVITTKSTSHLNPFITSNRNDTTYRQKTIPPVIFHFILFFSIYPTGVKSSMKKHLIDNLLFID